MRIERRYTRAGQSPYEGLDFRTTTSEIRNPNGSVVFRLEDLEVPAAWSQVAADVLAQKYFRKAGVPAALKRVEEPTVPSWLWRSVADEAALAKLPEADRWLPETTARQVFDRLAGTWTYWGWKGGYFDGEDDARAFHDELCHMLATQKCAPNSPQWFNTGLHWAYGIDGPSQGHYYVDHGTGIVAPSESAYEHPQPHACFIQGIEDDLVNEGGIMDLWVREARLFKYGSGTGSNFSNIRGENEPLSGGGKSSGLMSFLKIGDRAAGAIKSGGTTRRAAKMVVVDVDHPDIEEYVGWKVKEEAKVAALVAGSKAVKQHLGAIIKACVNCEGEGLDCFEITKNPALKRAVRDARRAHVPDAYIKRVIQFARQGATEIAFDTYDTDWDGEAYRTVSGQNSNNSVRVTDTFLRAVETDGDWDLNWRTRRASPKRSRRATCGTRSAMPPGPPPTPASSSTPPSTTGTPARPRGPIRASNPCSEYMFLDDTACNLASLNLLQFRIAETGGFDATSFEHAVRLWTLVLEISVMMAQFPSRRIAELSYEYRTLGLGFANLGGLLMSSGFSYDSDEGRALCGAISALMTGTAYATSAEMAGELGAFPGFAENRDAMLKVMRNHARAAQGATDGYEDLSTLPVALDHANCPDPDLVGRARTAWERAVSARRGARVSQRPGHRHRPHRHHRPRHGLRHDRHRARLCAGQVQEARRRRLLQDHQPVGAGSLARPRLCPGPDLRDRHLCGRPRHPCRRARRQPRHAQGQGLRPAQIAALEENLTAAFDIKFVFNRWTLGEDFCRDTLKLSEDELADPATDILSRLGFSRADVEAANVHVCGAMTLEGAPHLKASTIPSSTAPIRAAGWASAISRSTATSP
jgi:ribonucleoside-diphosphate reductase alpha chain